MPGEGKFLELFWTGERGKYSTPVRQLCSWVVLAVHDQGGTLNPCRVCDRIHCETIEPRLLSAPIHKEFSGGKGGHMHKLEAVPNGVQHGIKNRFNDNRIRLNAALVYRPQQSGGAHGLSEEDCSRVGEFAFGESKSS